MIGDVDAVASVLDAPLGVLAGEDAFGQQRDLHERADLVEEFPLVPEAAFGHSVLPARRAPRIRRAAASRPTSAGDVAQVQRALVGRRRYLLIASDHDRLGAGRLDFLQHVAIVVDVLLGIELEPHCTGRRRRHFVEREARRVADDVRHVGRRGPLVSGHLAVGMQRSMTGAGRHHDRIWHLSAQNLGRGFDGADVGDSARHELDPVERLAIAPQRELAVGAIRHVVVGGSGEPGVGHGFEIESVLELVHAGNAAVISKWILLRAQQRGACEKERELAKRVAAAHTIGPQLVWITHRTCLPDTILYSPGLPPATPLV